MEPGLWTLVDGLLTRSRRKGRRRPDRGLRVGHPGGDHRQPVGVPHADRGPLRDWSLAILGAFEFEADARAGGRQPQRDSRCTAYLRELVRERRAHPGDPAHDVLTRV